MLVYLTLTALLLAVAALTVAISSARHTRRAARELARELVQLRERVLAGEGTRNQGQEPSRVCAADGGASGELLAALTPRLEELETRLRSLMSSRGAQTLTPGASEEQTGVRALIVGHLERVGYSHMLVLEERADGGLLIEAARDGSVAKGIARLGSDGGLAFEPVHSTRAFP